MTTTARDLAGLDDGRVSLTPRRLDELEAQVADSLLLRAGEEGWDDAVLIWNGMVAVPALVLQPTSAPIEEVVPPSLRRAGLPLSATAPGLGT